MLSQLLEVLILVQQPQPIHVLIVFQPTVILVLLPLVLPVCQDIILLEQVVLLVLLTVPLVQHQLVHNVQLI